ncbi:carbohydrate ABC transporter permease [Salinirussus salinus]|jgi:multiple sugar transport system permease protein|uniref:carbohydrate ABC transporter permease n=1 Tax=Salinirussus salinus TaxID=1198300 RepID=UPI00135967F7|nr:carbohydrate ABC transporter permease [Salinirussus salinus]
MSTDTPSDTDGIFGLGYRAEEKLFSRLKQISAAVFVVVGVFPIYWMLQASLTTRARASSSGISWFPTPETFTLENYEVLTNPDVALYVINSVVVTLGTIILVVLISLIAGYGLARFNMPQKENFARFLLLGYLFSPIVLGVPLYLIWQNLGLLNTRLGLIIALTAISMPFAVWLMWKYIQTIPEAMEESAWVAGASRWQGFRDIIIPQTQPAIIAAALFAFALAWNDFTFAQILLPANEASTFAPGVFRLIQRGYDIARVDVMAVSMAMTLPPLIFAYFMQSYLLKGFQIRSL